MKVLEMPGGEGGPRERHCMPPDSGVQKFADGLLRLGLPEIEEGPGAERSSRLARVLSSSISAKADFGGSTLLVCFRHIAVIRIAARA